MTPGEPRRSTESRKARDGVTGPDRDLADRVRGPEVDLGNVDGEAPSEPGDAIVPIETHCDGCDQLSEPPDFRCDHPDGRIVEVLERDRVRVRGCPVVANGDDADS